MLASNRLHAGCLGLSWCPARRYHARCSRHSSFCEMSFSSHLKMRGKLCGIPYSSLIVLYSLGASIHLSRTLLANSNTAKKSPTPKPKLMSSSQITSISFDELVFQLPPNSPPPRLAPSSRIIVERRSIYPVFVYPAQSRSRRQAEQQPDKSRQ